MRRRVACILLIAFQALFLNVIVPGHTRGSITLSARCCRNRSDPAKAPGQKERAQCAICHLAARVTTPPVIDVQLTDLGLRQSLAIAPVARLITLQLPLTCYERAPPCLV